MDEYTDETAETELRKWYTRADRELIRGRPGFSDWIYVGPLSVYLRLTKRFVNTRWYNTIEISSVNVEEEYQGQKIFKQFFELFETFAHLVKRTIRVESVINPKLEAFLSKQGYEIWGDPSLINMFKYVEGSHTS